MKYNKSTYNKIFLLKSGFTIIEIVLVLAIFALGTTIFIVNFEKLQDTLFGVSDPKGDFEAFVKKSKYYAARKHRPVALRYKKKKKLLIVVDSKNRILDNLELGNKRYAKNLEISFYPAYFKEGFSSKWEYLKTRAKRIVFTPSGESSHVFVNFKIAGSEDLLYRLDPFSGKLVSN